MTTRSSGAGAEMRTVNGVVQCVVDGKCVPVPIDDVLARMSGEFTEEFSRIAAMLAFYMTDKR